MPSCSKLHLHRRITSLRTDTLNLVYTAISRKVVGKNVHATIPKGNMGYDQYTVPDNCSCRTYFSCFPLAIENTFLWPFVPILSNFFEERRTQNHPQCLLGSSRALFPTTFLEIAVHAILGPAAPQAIGLQAHRHTLYKKGDKRNARNIQEKRIRKITSAKLSSLFC